MLKCVHINEFIDLTVCACVSARRCNVRALRGCISNLSSRADLVKSIRISRDSLICVKICKRMHKHTHRDKKSRSQKAQIINTKSTDNSYNYHFDFCCNKSKKK